MKRLEQVLDFLVAGRKMTMLLEELLDELALFLGVHGVLFIVKIPSI
jgi:hypothetical protein